MSNIPTLDGLTDPQRDWIADGCGGKGFDVPDWIFHPACQQHDLGYWIGCTETDRCQVDLKFYNDMLVLTKPQPWYKRWLYISLAYTYYKSVRLFASKHFYFGEKKRTFDDLTLEMGVVTTPTLTASGPQAVPAINQEAPTKPEPAQDHTGQDQIVS
jgi:hypothetical protein